MESNAYIISLDAVDLNLLPITQKACGDKVVPLWTSSNLDLRSNDYYEFKVKTNEDTRPEDKNIPVTEYVTCDICDLDVPKVYFNEHKISFKHKFSKKIADEALKRLQLYLKRQDDGDLDNIEREPSKTFCPECSIIVDRKDAASHRKSITHKHSLVLERFLSDFLHFYSNDDKLIEEQEAVTETVIKRDDLVNKNDESLDITKIDGLVNENTKNDKSLNILKRDNLIHDNTLKDKQLDVRTDKQISNDIIKNELLALVSETKVAKNGLLQDLKTDKTQMNTTNEQSKENIKKDPLIPSNITISDYLILLNKKLNTSPMTFKSVGSEVEIKTIDGCRVRVPEKNFYGFLTIGSHEYCLICQLLLQDHKVHLLSDEHMKFVSLPLEDKHCLRMISNSKGHCLVCNVSFQHSITHMHSSQHIENLKEVIIFDNLKENEDKVANVNKKTVESISNGALKATIANVSKGTPETNTLENATASNEVTVNDETNNILETNVWGSSSDYYEQPGKNFVKFLRQDVKETESTDAAVAKETETTAAIANETGITYAAVSKKTKAIDVTVTNKIGKADISVGNESEKTAGLAGKDKQTKSEINYYFCKVCQVKVPSNENNIKSHNTGRPHMLKLGALSSTKNAKAPAKVKTTDLNHHISRIDKNTLICRVCSVYLTAGEANIKTHNKGASHSNNYNDFLKRNRLIVRKNGIYCTICASKVAIGSEFSHCLTIRHVDNLD